MAAAHCVHVWPMQLKLAEHWVLLQQLPGMHVSVTPPLLQHSSEGLVVQAWLTVVQLAATHRLVVVLQT